MARTTKPKSSLPQRIARLAGTVLMSLGVLALVWGFVIWRWGDPVTGLYTRWEQHKLAAQLEVVEREYRLPPPQASADAMAPIPDPTPKPSPPSSGARRKRCARRPALGSRSDASMSAGSA